MAIPIWGKSWSTMQVTNNETRRPMGSAPETQALGEIGRQAGVVDLLLRGRNIVRNALIDNRAGVGVIRGVAGAGVAIARLADRARIDHIAATGIDLQRRPRLPRGNLRNGFDAGLVPDESALQMRVSEKCQPALQIAEGIAGFVSGHHVIVFIPRRAV